MDDIERKAMRTDGLDPDDPRVVAAIDLVRWELALLAQAQDVRDPYDSTQKRSRLSQDEVSTSDPLQHDHPIIAGITVGEPIHHRLAGRTHASRVTPASPLTVPRPGNGRSNTAASLPHRRVITYDQPPAVWTTSTEPQVCLQRPAPSDSVVAGIR